MQHPQGRKRSIISQQTGNNPGFEAREIKGRGAFDNPSNRFSTHSTSLCAEEVHRQSQAAPPSTKLIREYAKTIISSNQSPDIPFSQSINPYKGCEHGCIYCYARPTHEYLDLSPGLDFETIIYYKANTAERLREAFTMPNYQCQAITIGANTDPYQPAEQALEITRSILNVCLEFRHPVSIISKSSLVLRDLDLLQELASHNLCRVLVSVTTLNKELKNKLEPRTASPEARLRVLRELSAAGIPIGVLCAPIIPFINDHELEQLVARCADYKPDSINYILLRLPHSVSAMFQDWLQMHYPDKASRVMNTLRDCRGGKEYQAEFGSRMTGQGVFADLLAQRFKVACKRHTLNTQRMNDLNTDAFRSVCNAQHSLF